MEEEKTNDDAPAPASDRPMFEGDWQCAECKKDVPELPFQPAEDQEIFCKECYLAKRKNRRFGDRQMVQGDWECSECSKKITELPFQPSGDRPLFCRDCYRPQRT